MRGKFHALSMRTGNVDLNVDVEVGDLQIERYD